MADELTALRDAVEHTTSAVQSAVTLIGGLAERLKALPDPTGEIAAFTATLEADAQALGAAVVANTPAAEADPAPVPVEDTPTA